MIIRSLLIVATPYQGDIMWALSEPEHLSCEINRLLLEYNSSSVFVVRVYVICGVIGSVIFFLIFPWMFAKNRLLLEVRIYVICDVIRFVICHM